MDGMWDSIKRGLQDGAEVAITKAEELTLVGRARLDIAAAKTRLSRLHAELGAEVFRRLEAGQVGDLTEAGEVTSLCDRIREASTTLKDSQSEFEQVREELATDEGDEDVAPDQGPGVGT
jgi:hypothetical protein